MDSIDPFAPNRPLPTPSRPLLGLTVLVIEDSLYSCEAMRLLCLRSGARIRRADSLRSAKRHLQVYRPTIVIVDLGLPDGNGVDLIRDMIENEPRPQVVLGTSGDPFSYEAAMNAGADGFLAKPITSLAVFQEEILSNLPLERRPNGPRAINDEIIEPDPIAFQDDMAHIADVLEHDHDGRALDYAIQFLTGVARSAKDETLLRASETLAAERKAGRSTTSTIARISGLIQERLANTMAI